MALLDSITTYVNTALANQHRTNRDQEISRLNNCGELYLDSGGTLCVRACSHAMANLQSSTLPTRISAAANTQLTALRELFNAGLLSGSGLKLHDQDAGVTVQVIP